MVNFIFILLLFKKDSISNIKDPEFNNYTLEDLNIVDFDKVYIHNKKNFYEVLILWKPTVKTCKFTENIGLAMRYQLLNDEVLIKYNNIIKYSFILEENSHYLKSESKIKFKIIISR